MPCPGIQEGLSLYDSPFAGMAHLAGRGFFPYRPGKRFSQRTHGDIQQDIQAYAGEFLRGFSKRHRDGLSGCFDGILGLAAGAIKGAILVLLFLALLMPFINFVSPDSADAVMQSLQQSYIAGFLYDHNVILLSGQLNISNLF